jgi:hypothetical protein
MAKMVLFGGEKDGYGMDGELIISGNHRPQVFYAVPILDEDKIKKTHGHDAKRELRDKLAVLAYEFDENASTADLFVMRRKTELDKVRQG